jgi:radical SAM superfamily enzyme YgiQ (UPF0313 family)
MQGIIFNVTQYAYLSRPLGGHRIAHYLREQGWDIEVVDWANWWSIEELKTLWKQRWADDLKFIGFSHLFSMWDPKLEDFCLWIKTHYKDVKILSGSAVNPHFKSKAIDYYIQGFGEKAITHLLKYLFGNGKAPVTKFGTNIISAINNYPAYPMDSLMVDYEKRDFIDSNEWLTVEFARGCMFECAYCNFPVLGVRGDYSRTSKDFKRQLQTSYDKWGIKKYLVSDETFNDKTSKIIKFADAVEELSFEPWFSGYIRADLLVSRPSDKEHLLRMNFLGQYYGIESFNYESAKTIGKGMDPEKLKKGLLEIKQYFTQNKQYRGNISLIVGLPYDSKDDIIESYEWLKQNWIDQAMNFHSLTIPNGNGLDKLSKFSLNREKYGYTESSNHAPLPSSILKKKYSYIIDEWNWQSQYMNKHESIEIVNQIYKNKDDVGFVPGPFDLAYRTKVKNNFSLTYKELDNCLNFDISQYIENKLGV